MKILGIETSCDETAAAVLEIHDNNVVVLSNVISSQVKIHAKYGGVVPHLAAREHAKNIVPVFKLALEEAGIKAFGDIDLVAVTRGPGLGPALLMGLAFAKTLTWKYDLPLIGVNHLEGHIYSNWLPPIASQKSKAKNQKSPKEIFPALNLIVSGGHTELVLMNYHGKYKIIGETLDDAVGEAFDKVARLLNLGYPGGPAISARAEKYQKSNLKSQKLEIVFPKPMAKSKDFNFSYSGLKTSVLYKVKELKKEDVELADAIIDKICYEFQKAAIEVLVQKTLKAATQFKVKSVLLSGGVSANKYLREELSKSCAKAGIEYFQPEMQHTTDNAAMIACAGYFSFRRKKTKNGWRSAAMDANLSFNPLGLD